MKILCTLLLYLAVGHLLAQTTQIILEAHGATVPVLKVTEVVEVYRSVEDSVVSIPPPNNSNLYHSLGTHTDNMVIPLPEVQHFNRQFFNDGGVIWTRLTNDKLITDKPYYISEPISDSVIEVRRPVNFYMHDTVTQIDPVNMVEEVVIVIDSSPLNIHYSLGKFSKTELKDAIRNQFGIGGHCPYGIQALRLEFLNGDGSWMEMAYDKPAEVEAALAAIDKLPVNTRVLFSSLQFKNKRTGGTVSYYPILFAVDVE